MTRSSASRVMTGHPTDLDLELVRTGEADAAASVHVASCALCRERSALLVAIARDQGLSTVATVIPLTVERAIRMGARQRALEVRRRLRARRLVRWGSGAAAAAALLLVAVNLPYESWRHPAPPVEVRGDLNHDGTVDILDALTVARAVGRANPDRSWDVTLDGRIDSEDVEWVARTAVSIAGRSVG